MKTITLFIAIFIFSCLPKTTYSQDSQSFFQNQKSQDIKRAKYWKERGYTFNPEYMCAFMMDEKVKDIERAKYWKTRGYTFNPEYMCAFMMDERVREIERGKQKPLKRESNFYQNRPTAYQKYPSHKQKSKNYLSTKSSTTRNFTPSNNGIRKPKIKSTYTPQKPRQLTHSPIYEEKNISPYNQKKSTSSAPVYNKDIAPKPRKKPQNKEEKNIWILIVAGIGIFLWWINKSFSSNPTDQTLENETRNHSANISEETKQEQLGKGEQPIATEQKEKELFCHRNGLYSLYHMTNVSNLPNIFQYGILNNYDALRRNLTITDISDPGVQQWRDRKEPCYNRPIHEYAPLYINPQNPMLFVRKEIQDEICILEISCAVLDEQEFVFTDGNAASRTTKFYKSLDDLNNIPWDVINDDRWDYFDDGKRKRCAEFLIFPAVDIKYIRCLHFLNSSIANKYCKNGYLCKSTRSLFF